MSEPLELTSIDGLIDVLPDRTVDERIVIAVAGPPGSGKSTTAELLAETLNRREPGTSAVLPMDGYHYDDLVLDQRGQLDRKGAPHTFDLAGFAHMLTRLRRNDDAEVAVPVFDRSLEVARAGARIIPQSVTHLVVEGNYLLLDIPPWDSLAPHFDITVFIDVPEAELRRRLLKRWSGLSGDALTRKLEDNDMPNVRLVRSASRQADVVLRHDEPSVHEG